MVDTLDLFGNEDQPLAKDENSKGRESSSVKKTNSRKAKTNSAQKSDKAYRTISEAAEELDVATHVLRFWETKFKNLKPMKRAGGRRYYSPDDLNLLKEIKHLLYTEGLTIKGVQTHFKKGNSKDSPVGNGVEINRIKEQLMEIRELL